MYALAALKETAVLLESGLGVNCVYSPRGESLVCAVDGSLFVHQVVEGLGYTGITAVNAASDLVVSYLTEGSVAHSTDVKTGECLRLLDLESGKYTRVFSGHTSEVYSLSSCCTTKRMLSCAENEILLWDQRMKEAVGKIPAVGHSLAKYSPDDASVITVLFKEKCEMKLFDARSYTTGPYATKELDIDGEWLDMCYSWSGHTVALSTPEALVLLDGIKGSLLGYLPTEYARIRAFSPDDDYLVYSREEGVLSVCTANNLKDVTEISVGGPVSFVDFNPGYDQLVVVGQKVSLWQVNSENE
ncbi:COMPASS component SWD2 [Nematocida homosporus]|uniref:COMPASS component SWD2 n=1 Tax=Nematocida homosporus TaxID=1912981 RepID=UPI00221F986A|nr:COMPASS component SWD2 [Nematocida homosporus]KAI5185235.1 COMPASS component SWD2 [Nematocida homosporus]